MALSTFIYNTYKHILKVEFRVTSTIQSYTIILYSVRSQHRFLLCHWNFAEPYRALLFFSEFFEFLYFGQLNTFGFQELQNLTKQ